MGKYFGTDGIRGTVGKELTVDLALKVGKALSYFEEKDVYIGYDTRISNHMIASSIASGALAFGKNVYDVGVISTPGLAYHSKKNNTIAVMVTASHNPYMDNGIKIFYHGIKMSDKQEADIEKLISSPSFSYPIPYDGKYTFGYNKPVQDYIDYLNSISQKFNKRIALDCANGATSFIAPEVYKHLSDDVLVIGNNPDGYNINKGVGSTHLDNLSQFVKDNNCDVGFAYDGDGDRILVVDEKGKKYSGDEIIYIIASELFKEGKLKNNTVVLTRMSNLGIINNLKAQGINVSLTDVGDRNVLMEMLEHDYVIGGENSGHVINLDYLHTGDGIITSIVLCNIMAKTSKTLEELTSSLTIYPESLVNLKVKDKNIAKKDIIQNKVEEFNAKYNGELKLIVRASGTENLLRVSCCAKNKEDMENAIDTLVKLIQEEEKKI